MNLDTTEIINISNQSNQRKVQIINTSNTTIKEGDYIIWRFPNSNKEDEHT